MEKKAFASRYLCLAFVLAALGEVAVVGACTRSYLGIVVVLVATGVLVVVTLVRAVPAWRRLAKARKAGSDDDSSAFAERRVVLPTVEMGREEYDRLVEVYESHMDAAAALERTTEVTRRVMGSQKLRGRFRHLLLKRFLKEEDHLAGQSMDLAVELAASSTGRRSRTGTTDLCRPGRAPVGPVGWLGARQDAVKMRPFGPCDRGELPRSCPEP